MTTSKPKDTAPSATTAFATTKPQQQQMQRTLPSLTFLRREDSCFFYPFGNSVPEDLFLHIDLFNTSINPIDTLLVGSGDLRNVLFTLAEAKRKLSGQQQQHQVSRAEPQRKVSFHLNDHQPEVIARNIVILHAIVAAPSSTPTLVRNIAQFWYSLALDKDVAEFWRAQMSACVDRTDDEWLSETTTVAFPIRMAGRRTVQQVKHAWRTWIKCDWTLTRVVKARETFLRNCPRKYKSLATYATLVTESYVAFNSIGPLGAKSRKSPIAVEAEHLVEHGRLFNLDSSTDLVCNPSMLLTRSDGTCFYAVHYGTLPMEGHVFNYTANHGIEEGIWRNLMQWIECISSLVTRSTSPAKKPIKTSKQPIVIGEFVFNADHYLQYMESCIASPKTRFDVIDTSNLADHCGLLNLLIHSPVLLKPVDPLMSTSHMPHVITTSFLMGHECSKREKYLAEMLTMDISQIPTLLGVRLLEHTDQATSWGSVVVPWAWSVLHVTGLTKREHHRFTWLGCPMPPVPVSLAESPVLVDTLVKIAETYCTSYMFKSTRPGGPFSNGALLGKLLTHAIATGRLSWTQVAKPTLPLASPTSFWHRLMDSRLLQGAVSELLVHCQLNGLQVNARDMDDFVVYAEATFPLDFGTSPTPGLVAWVEFGHVTFFSESLALDVDSAKKSAKLAVYLPGFIWDWDLSTVKLSLHRMEDPLLAARSSNAAASIPLGKKYWTLVELGARRVHVSESPWWAITRQMLSKVPGRSPAVSKIVDHGTQASVFLDLNHFGQDATLVLPTADDVRSSRGAAVVKINGKLERFWLASPVWLKNVKISRKKKFVELIVTKQMHAFAPKSGLLGLPFHQSVSGVHNITSPKDFPERDWGQMLGIMFSHDEIEVKKRAVPRNFATRAFSIAFDLKESVQILFIRAFEGRDYVLLQDHERGGFGIILINQVLLFPPTRTSKGWTPALDIVYSVIPPAPDTPESHAFQERYLDAMEEVLRKHMINYAPILKVDGDEVQAICDLLDLAHHSCGNKDLPSPMPGRMPNMSSAAKKFFQRGILTPLYPADGLERANAAMNVREGASGAPKQKRAHAEAKRTAQAMVREMMASGKDPMKLARELGIDLSQLQLS